METIIQAGNKRLAIVSVPIKTNAKTRESRLFKNIWQHVFKSATSIIRAYLMYRPYIVFVTLGIFLLLAGLFPFVRYFILMIAKDGGDHIQSLLVGATLLIGALLSFSLGIIADLVRTNRVLHEDTLERLKKMQYKKD
jgi:hypothetical protein